MHSIWESSVFHARPRVLVIGGGIVGLFTALFHKRENPYHHVVVAERGAFPSGASVKNAGFACYGSPSELLSDMLREGTEAAVGRVAMRWEGLRALRQEIGDEELGFVPSGGSEIFHAHDPRYAQVAEKFDRLNELLRPVLGFKPYQWADDGIAKFGLGSVRHLVRIAEEGPLHSGLLMNALLRRAVAAGVLFKGGTTVSRLEEHGDRVEAICEDGEVLAADQVVLALNGFTRMLRPDLDVVPARGQVLLTEPIPGLQLQGTFHYDEGFYYFREFGGGVLIGGGRNLDLAGERTWEEGTTEVVQQGILELLKEVVLPGREFRISQRWSGIMGFGEHGKTPLIERLSPKMVVAARLGGMGVAIGIKVARQAAELLK